MKKTLLVGIAALLLATGAAHAADWELDFRRCLAGHVAGAGKVVFRLWEGGFYDIATYPDYKITGFDFHINRMRVDGKDFPTPLGDEMILQIPFFRALAHGKRLQLFEEGDKEPYIDIPIGNGKMVASFLRKCPNISKRQWRREFSPK